ncbi:MAG: TIGR03546 family protein [Pirellulaceae bacterium]
MRYWLLRPLRYFYEALRESTTPHGLALGAALGMLVGLAPKDNLTAMLLAMLVLAIRNNLAAAALSALLFSWLAPVTDPLAHTVGDFLLRLRVLQPVYAFLYDLPLAPWTALNNTVVAGSLLIGLASFYPCYRVARYLTQQYGPALLARLEKYRLWRVLIGADFVAGIKAP